MVQGMRIWITGIAGFLGSHLAETLIAEGYEVRGNDNLICGNFDNLLPFYLPPAEIQADFTLKDSGRKLVGVDCRDFEEMKIFLDEFKPDVLIHCAATAHEGLSSFSPSFITKNIYEASVATFSAAIASGVKRIVYMSSMSRYGNGNGIDVEGNIIKFKPPFKEDEHLTYPVDPYGVAKVAAEDTLKILCQTHGVKWSILVPHNIIGPRQRYNDPFRNVASIMINRCLKGQPPIIYGDGLQKRCFSPIKDCLPSIVKAVHGEADGEVINIGPDNGEITILELARKIIEFTGFEGDPVYMEDRPNEVKEAYCSSEKARRILGYKEQQSIDDCLKEMIEDIRKKGTKDFDYSFPLEIVTERTPKTWTEKLI